MAGGRDGTRAKPGRRQVGYNVIGVYRRILPKC